MITYHSHQHDNPHEVEQGELVELIRKCTKVFHCHPSVKLTPINPMIATTLSDKLG